LLGELLLLGLDRLGQVGLQALDRDLLLALLGVDVGLGVGLRLLLLGLLLLFFDGGVGLDLRLLGLRGVAERLGLGQLLVEDHLGLPVGLLLQIGHALLRFGQRLLRVRPPAAAAATAAVVLRRGRQLVLDVRGLDRMVGADVGQRMVGGTGRGG